VSVLNPDLVLSLLLIKRHSISFFARTRVHSADGKCGIRNELTISRTMATVDTIWAT